jgi:hypothetical protein
MSQQRRVETVEDFKLRIAAIIRAQPDEIPLPATVARAIGSEQKAGEQSESKTSN